MPQLTPTNSFSARWPEQGRLHGLEPEAADIGEGQERGDLDGRRRGQAAAEGHGAVEQAVEAGQRVARRPRARQPHHARSPSRAPRRSWSMAARLNSAAPGRSSEAMATRPSLRGRSASQVSRSTVMVRTWPIVVVGVAAHEVDAPGRPEPGRGQAAEPPREGGLDERSPRRARPSLRRASCEGDQQGLDVGHGDVRHEPMGWRQQQPGPVGCQVGTAGDHGRADLIRRPARQHRLRGDAAVERQPLSERGVQPGMLQDLGLDGVEGREPDLHEVGDDLADAPIGVHQDRQAHARRRVRRAAPGGA